MIHTWDSPPDRRRMVELVRMFPTLADAACVGEHPGEFCVLAFRRWAKRHAHSHGARHAAAFVLAVFWGRTRSAGPHLPRFDVVDAMGTWDDSHRRAFLAWAREPWWP